MSFQICRPSPHHVSTLLCVQSTCIGQGSMPTQRGRWSYLGLGEPLCFVAFGPLATTAFYLAQVRT